MIRRITWLSLPLSLVGLLSAGTPALAGQAECRTTGIRRDAPVVTSAETASAIFRAVEDDFFPQADKAATTEVVAVDDGEWWSVFRQRRTADGARTVGGGQLSLRIAKCDGRISEIWLTR